MALPFLVYCAPQITNMASACKHAVDDQTEIYSGETVRHSHLFNFPAAINAVRECSGMLRSLLTKPEPGAVAVL